MKKLLSLFATVSITTFSISSVVACSLDENSDGFITSFSRQSWEQTIPPATPKKISSQFLNFKHYKVGWISTEKFVEKGSRIFVNYDKQNADKVKFIFFSAGNFKNATKFPSAPMIYTGNEISNNTIIAPFNSQLFIENNSDSDLYMDFNTEKSISVPFYNIDDETGSQNQGTTSSYENKFISRIKGSGNSDYATLAGKKFYLTFNTNILIEAMTEAKDINFKKIVYLLDSLITNLEKSLGLDVTNIGSNNPGINQRINLVGTKEIISDLNGENIDFYKSENSIFFGKEFQKSFFQQLSNGSVPIELIDAISEYYVPNIFNETSLYEPIKTFIKWIAASLQNNAWEETITDKFIRDKALEFLKNLTDSEQSVNSQPKFDLLEDGKGAGKNGYLSAMLWQLLITFQRSGSEIENRYAFSKNLFSLFRAQILETSQNGYKNYRFKEYYSTLLYSTISLVVGYDMFYYLRAWGLGLYEDFVDPSKEATDSSSKTIVVKYYIENNIVNQYDLSVLSNLISIIKNNGLTISDKVLFNPGSKFPNTKKLGYVNNETFSINDIEVDKDFVDDITSIKNAVNLNNLENKESNGDQKEFLKLNEKMIKEENELFHLNENGNSGFVNDAFNLIGASKDALIDKKYNVQNKSFNFINGIFQSSLSTIIQYRAGMASYDAPDQNNSSFLQLPVNIAVDVSRRYVIDEQVVFHSVDGREISSMFFSYTLREEETYIDRKNGYNSYQLFPNARKLLLINANSRMWPDLNQPVLMSYLNEGDKKPIKYGQIKFSFKSIFTGNGQFKTETFEITDTIENSLGKIRDKAWEAQDDSESWNGKEIPFQANLSRIKELDIFSSFGGSLISYSINFNSKSYSEYFGRIFNSSFDTENKEFDNHSNLNTEGHRLLKMIEFET